MQHLYTQGTVTIDGKEYDAEATYEVYEGSIVIHGVRAIRQVANKGEYWYDRNGEGYEGPKFVSIDVTDWVDIAAWKEEIKAHNEWWESAKRVACRTEEEWKASQIEAARKEIMRDYAEKQRQMAEWCAVAWRNRGMQ